MPQCPWEFGEARQWDTAINWQTRNLGQKQHLASVLQLRSHGSVCRFQSHNAIHSFSQASGRAFLGTTQREQTCCLLDSANLQHGPGRGKTPSDSTERVPDIPDGEFLSSAPLGGLPSEGAQSCHLWVQWRTQEVGIAWLWHSRSISPEVTPETEPSILSLGPFQLLPVLTSLWSLKGFHSFYFCQYHELFGSYAPLFLHEFYYLHILKLLQRLLGCEDI